MKTEEDPLILITRDLNGEEALTEGLEKTGENTGNIFDIPFAPQRDSAGIFPQKGQAACFNSQ